jgi:hypothetical protein
MNTGGHNRIIIIDADLTPEGCSNGIDIQVPSGSGSSGGDSGGGTVITKHNDLTDIQGGDANNRYHLVKSQWDAIRLANNLSASNVVISQDDLQAALDALPTIPTKTSDLSNDSGFITSASIPTTTSDLTNDSGFITINDVTIPTLLSQLANDTGFITGAALPTKTSDLTNDSGFITASEVPAQTFDSNFVVSLGNGKTLGKYQNGDTVPALGKTAIEVLKMAAVEAIAPVVTLAGTSNIAFNQTNVSNVLYPYYAIQSLNATVATVALEWRRNNTGSWITLSTDTGVTTYTHNYTDTNFNTAPYNYRYTVTDSAGGIATATHDVTVNAYVAPSITLTQVAAALNGTQTNTTREKGNVSTNLSGSITVNSTNVTLSSYQLQYSVNGTSSWTNLGSGVVISGTSGTISSTNHNDSSLKSTATSINYRVQVTDTFTTTTSNILTVNFLYLYLFGYSTINGALTDSQAYALGNGVLSSTKVRTIVATATSGNYTFILPPPGSGNLSNIIQNSALSVLSAFNGAVGSPAGSTPIGTVVVTNQYGVTGTYSINKSNQTQAFTGDTLAIT